MKNKRAVLPNFFTLSNIFLGFLALLYISEGRYTTAAWCIITASILDLFDGKLARWTKTYSSFGKELDSFADAISFGVAPAFLVFETNFRTVGLWGALFCFIFILAGVFRLARFNIQTKGFKKKHFTGLPIPVAALALASFFLMTDYFWNTVVMVQVLLALVPALSLLMVSTLKFETIPSLVPVRRNKWRNVKKFAYIAEFTLVIINPRVWFFIGTMAYIVIEMAEGIVVKFLEEDDDEVEISIDEERNIH